MQSNLVVALKWIITMLARWELVRGGVDVAIAQAKRERRRRETKRNCHAGHDKQKCIKINTDMCISLKIVDGVYRIARKFGGELNLAVYITIAKLKSTKISYSHITYGIPYRITKILNPLLFLQWRFWAQLPNLILANISGYTVLCLSALINYDIILLYALVGRGNQPQRWEIPEVDLLHSL